MAVWTTAAVEDATRDECQTLLCERTTTYTRLCGQLQLVKMLPEMSVSNLAV